MSLPTISVAPDSSAFRNPGADNPPPGHSEVPHTDSPPLACEVCGTGLTYAGRGRKPRFCADHKPKGSSTNTGQKRKSSRGTMGHDEVATAMTGLLGIGSVFCLTLGSVLKSQPLILDAQTVADHSRNVGEAVAKWGDTNPGVAGAIKSTVELAGIMGVIVACAPMGVGIAQNHGVVPTPSKPLLHSA